MVGIIQRLAGIRQIALIVWVFLCVIWNVAASAAYLPRIVSFPPQLETYGEVADYLANGVLSAAPMFTFETPLAVATGHSVAPGMEMSYFSFFPGWPTSFCRNYHLLNDEMIADELVGAPFSAIILSDFDLYLLRGRTGERHTSTVDPLTDLPELKSRYHLAGTFPNMGVFRDRLYILLPNAYSSTEVSATR